MCLNCLKFSKTVRFTELSEMSENQQYTAKRIDSFDCLNRLAPVLTRLAPVLQWFLTVKQRYYTAETGTGHLPRGSTRYRPPLPGTDHHPHPPTWMSWPCRTPRSAGLCVFTRLVFETIYRAQSAVYSPVH